MENVILLAVVASVFASVLTYLKLSKLEKLLPKAQNWEDEVDDDELYETAKTEVIKAGKASTSYLQRKLSIGYARAARLIDMLEERGVIGPGVGAEPRKVTKETR